MKILSIVETAYRATLEEQDDTILWLNHALKNHGADVSLLLRGNAVNYLMQGQDASGLTVGTKSLAHAAQPDRELAQLIGAKVLVFAVEDDLQERALRREHLIDGFEPVSRNNLPALLERFDQVWHW
jgi:sulfur relay (sulfurtransferase) DsrF/TusC family protein